MQNRKKLIGIIPSASLFRGNNIYDDRYIFINNYAKMLSKNGYDYFGIIANDGNINVNLDIFDSFLICGGRQIHPYHIQIIDYCYKNNKKILGVCLGMQAIHSYFVALDNTNKYSNVFDTYMQMKKDKYMFVNPVENHWKVKLDYNNLDMTMHNININKDTMLYDLVRKTTLQISSMHNYAITKPSNRLKISAYSDDKTIEAIEYKDLFLGIQFHPEVDISYSNIFNFL